MSFTAKYPGRCDDCREAIEPGDDRTLVHVVCDGPGVDQMTDLDRDAKREVCPECFLLKPCVCGVF
ncbi:hypothetical protein [Agromyces aureus]|uniref:hypothetical protein n=1 Tax=Agromyces aureus TaxID=453304 RepID=UPI000A9A4B5A|nr:hypothetical protein [Agromyces aureus]